jgi:hypothetical protein
MTYGRHAVARHESGGISADEKVVDVLPSQDTGHLACDGIEVPILIRTDWLGHLGGAQCVVEDESWKRWEVMKGGR